MFYMSKSGSHESGFTLIEVLIVIIIIGVIASMAYPSMSAQIANMRINSAKNTIASSIKDAQAQSAILRKPVWIVFTKTDDAPTSITLSTTETPTADTTLAKNDLPKTTHFMQNSGTGIFRVTPSGILQKKNGSDYAPATHVFYVCDTLRSGNTVMGLKYQGRTMPIAQAQTTESAICGS